MTMRLFPLFCAALLSACAAETDYLSVTPEVPEPLLTPVPAPDRKIETIRDASLLLIDYSEALKRANSQITAIADILKPGPAKPATPRN